MSEIIGFDNVVKLYENFKGSQINFPTRLFSKEFVLEEALKAYDGTSESIWLRQNTRIQNEQAENY